MYIKKIKIEKEEMQNIVLTASCKPAQVCVVILDFFILNQQEHLRKMIK